MNVTKVREDVASSQALLGGCVLSTFDVRRNERSRWQRVVFWSWTTGGQARRVSEELAGVTRAPS